MWERGRQKKESVKETKKGKKEGKIGVSFCNKYKKKGGKNPLLNFYPSQLIQSAILEPKSPLITESVLR